jgi:predicted AAA+ superfamily ATPase
VDIRPFDVLEAGNTAPERDRLWLRGGFPASFLAASGSISLRWRLEFIRSCLEHDLPRFAPRIPAERLRRLWTMLAHHQGGLLNVAQFGRNLGVDTRTAGSDIDLLVNLLLVRRLPPWQTDVGKRLTKAPKAYVRDSGLVHALLAIGGKETLLSHPVVGASWEGFAIEQLLAAAPRGSSAYFYRTSGGAEIDLLLSLPGDRLWAIDMKRSLTPRPDRGFSSACADVKPERRFLVYAGEESVQLGDDILATPLRALARLLARA